MMIVAILSWIISFSDRYFIINYMDQEAVGEYSLLAQFSKLCSCTRVYTQFFVNPILYKTFAIRSVRWRILFKKSLLILLLFLLFSYLIYLTISDQIIGIFITGELLEKESMRLVVKYFLVASAMFTVLITAVTLRFHLEQVTRTIINSMVFRMPIVNLIGNFFIARIWIQSVA